MGLQRAGRQAIQRGVDKREEFEQGNLRGRLFNNGFSDRGQLPYDIALPTSGPVYVIYSYATPIAWCVAGAEWIVPDVRYSVTTSHHQNVVRTAIDNPGFYLNHAW